jgi:hypothetical protein
MSTENSFAEDSEEREFRSKVVDTILAGSPEHALKLLSEYYGVNPPEIRVGTVKAHRRALACYVEKERRIYFSKSEYLSAPFVVLHEFYHHLRASQINSHRQVEKGADLFASNYIQDHRRFHTLYSLHRGD